MICRPILVLFPILPFVVPDPASPGQFIRAGSSIYSLRIMQRLFHLIPTPLFSPKPTEPKLNLPEEPGKAKPFSTVKKGLWLYCLAENTVDADLRAGFPPRLSSTVGMTAFDLQQRSRRTWKDNWQLFNAIRLRGVTVRNV